MLDTDKVKALQFLKNGRVRATLKTTAYRDKLLRGSSLLYGDVAVPVTAAYAIFCPVYALDLPFEVANADVVSVFQALGLLKSICRCFFRDFPSVAYGTHVLLMSFYVPLLSLLYVAQYPVWRGTLVNLISVPCAVSLVICPRLPLPRLCDCTVNSWVTWSGNVRLDVKMKSAKLS